VRVLLSLGYGSGRRAGEAVKLKVKQLAHGHTPNPVSKPRSARSRQHPRPSFKPRRQGRRSRLNFSNTRADPNPHSVRGTAGCRPHRDFVPWRFSDAGLSCTRMALCSPASENLPRTDLLDRPRDRANAATYLSPPVGAAQQWAPGGRAW
jgi:hypothetical protein